MTSSDHVRGGLIDSSIDIVPPLYVSIQSHVNYHSNSAVLAQTLSIPLCNHLTQWVSLSKPLSALSPWFWQQSRYASPGLSIGGLDTPMIQVSLPDTHHRRRSNTHICEDQPENHLLPVYHPGNRLVLRNQDTLGVLQTLQRQDTCFYDARGKFSSVESRFLLIDLVTPFGAATFRLTTSTTIARASVHQMVHA